MWYQRHFAQPSRAFIRSDEPLEYSLPLRASASTIWPLSNRTRMPSMNVPCYDSGLVELTVPLTRSLCGMVNDFFGRDVRVADDPVLGARCAAFPFMTVDEADRQVSARTR